MYAAATAATGYLLCDGSAVSRATYSTLFGVISTAYGAGNGSTTFNVPDFRGRVPLGAGTGTGGGASGTGAPTGGSALTAVSVGTWKGEETHVLSVGELAAHTHGPGGSYTAFAGHLDGSGAGLDSGDNNVADAMALTGSTGSNTAHNNIQPVAGISFMIKT
jgi:microcystin-dependent protein